MSTFDVIKAEFRAIGAKPSFQFKDIATLSSAYWAVTYEPAPAGSGWVELGLGDTPSGYDGRALFHENSQTFVVINRGAEGGLLGKDWAEGLNATLGKNSKPIHDGLDFAAEAWRQVEGSAKSAFFTGQSWGGALAESQTALFRQTVGNLDLKVKGVGFASAGFRHAIEKVAAKRSLDLIGSFGADIKHYIRKYDPIRLLPDKAYFGPVIDVGSIFTQYMEPAPAGQHPATRKVNKPLYDVNHSGPLYFKYPDLSPSRFVQIELDGTERIVDKPRP